MITVVLKDGHLIYHDAEWVEYRDGVVFPVPSYGAQPHPPAVFKR